MRINEITIKNAKSFKEETTVTFGKRLNILIGPNAGGKSNLLEITQGIFNDLFFEDIVFQENNDENTKRTKHHKIEKVAPNNQNLLKNILDYFEGQENQPQAISILLTIEKSDIQNLNLLKNIKDKLIEFESEVSTSTLIKDTIANLNLDLDYRQIIGKQVDIKIENRTLVDIAQAISDPIIKEFYGFLKLSKIFYKFINFYNLLKNGTAKFAPFVYYVPANREPINLTNEPYHTDLNSISSISTNQFLQSGITQDTRQNLWGLVLKVLAENYCLGQKRRNKAFKKLLNEHMGIDFSITPSGNIFQKNVYDINFFRIGSNYSIKLSSGEKELLNFIILTYLYKGGIFLIDEPELHLHRRWQKKLLNLFSDIIQKYNVQLILVTHSPHFIKNEVLGNLIRIYKEDGQSKIVVPDKKELSKKTQKDIFLFITSSNNEKVFFANKVILVEGIVDRIIFESILQTVQKEDNDEIIEMVEVLGKDNFKRFASFLDTWKINHAIIADNDYLLDIGSKEVKKLYVVDTKKIKNQIGNKNSKDIKTLLNCLLKVTRTKSHTKISEEEYDNLKQLTKYIAKRYVRLKDSLTNEQKATIEKEISKLKVNKVFVLKGGEIEDYFNNGSKIDISKAIIISKKIRGKKTSPPSELNQTIKEIVEN